MAEIESLPLFPLADVVLLPEVSVPLYIFEPRYRQMTEDALAGGHQIGMVAVRPDAVSGMAGDPALFEIGCLGRIAHCEKRPDGTYQMLLIGEQRFRILEEWPSNETRLYRSARVELLVDVLPDSDADAADVEGASVRLAARRAELMNLLEELMRTIQSNDEREQILSTFAELPHDRLVNSLTQSISFMPIERQQLLEADSITTRIEIMSELLRFKLAATPGRGSGTSSLPN